MQGKGGLSTPFPHSSPLQHLPELQVGGIRVCVCIYNVARHSSLHVKTGMMKSIFLIGTSHLRKIFLSRHRVLHPFLFIYFDLIVFTVLSTSFSIAPDSEVTNVIRTGEQSLPMAAQECGAPDHFPYSHLSAFLLSHSSTRSSCSIHFQPEGKTSRQLSRYESDFKLWFGGEDFSFISHLQNKEHLFLTLAVLC